jgi:hypothetical protein
VKTEAVELERTVLLRLPCLSVCQPSSTLVLAHVCPTLNHRLLHGQYTCCYTPIPRAYQLQPHSFALLDKKEQQSGFAAPQYAAFLTRSSALRRERQTQGTYNTLRIYDDQTHNLCTHPGGTIMDVGAHGRATAEHNGEIACARLRGAHRDVTSSPQPDDHTPRVRRRRSPQQTRHTRRRETQLITTAACALLATCLPTAMAQESCISLTGSTACPAFNASSISTNSDLTGLFPFLSDVTDTESFDSEIQNYVSGRYAETKYAPTATSCSDFLLTKVQIPAALRL